MELITIRLRVRWWVMPYLMALRLFALSTGLTPDLERVGAFIERWGFAVDVKETDE